MIKTVCGLISGFVYGRLLYRSPSHDYLSAQGPYLVRGLYAAITHSKLFLYRNRPIRHQFTIAPMQFPRLETVLQPAPTTGMSAAILFIVLV